MNDPKAAAAYHPGDAPVTRPDFWPEPGHRDTANARAVVAWNEHVKECAAQPSPVTPGFPSHFINAYRLGESVADERAASALAAERARADQAERDVTSAENDGIRWMKRAQEAEQRIVDAPHDTECEVNRTEPSDHSYDDQCDCWKSAAPTAEQGATS